MRADLHTKLHKFVLGSAQFGLDYGISNTQGKVSYDEVKQILLKAREAGITTIDTAAAYGDSESTIGRALEELMLPMNIITKFPASGKYRVKSAFDDSLANLKKDKVQGYLLHNFSAYKENPDILQDLQELKAKGKVEKIGVSIYHPYEAEELLQKKEQVDILQFPYNVFDQRFDTILPKLAEQGIEAHVRSVYLQGLFFLESAKLPVTFKPVATKIDLIHQLAREENIPLGALLLCFVLANPHVTKVVLGVESVAHVTENIRYFKLSLSKKSLSDLQLCKETDENIILPYNW